MHESEAVGMEKVSVDGLADAVMKGLEEYAKLATDDMKKPVKDAGKFCKEEVSANAPVRTGKYKKSWKSKTTSENANAIPVIVLPTGAPIKVGSQTMYFLFL